MPNEDLEEQLLNLIKGNKNENMDLLDDLNNAFKQVGKTKPSVKKQRIFKESRPSSENLCEMLEEVFAPTSKENNYRSNDLGELLEYFQPTDENLDDVTRKTRSDFKHVFGYKKDCVESKTELEDLLSAIARLKWIAKIKEHKQNSSLRELNHKMFIKDLCNQFDCSDLKTAIDDFDALVDVTNPSVGFSAFDPMPKPNTEDYKPWAQEVYSRSASPLISDILKMYDPQRYMYELGSYINKSKYILDPFRQYSDCDKLTISIWCVEKTDSEMERVKSKIIECADDLGLFI